MAEAGKEAGKEGAEGTIELCFWPTVAFVVRAALSLIRDVFR